MPEGSRIARWRGLVGFAARRVVVRITHTERQQTRLTVLGIALAIAMLLIVTSVGLGLVAQSRVASADTDYWILPEGGASSAVTTVEGHQLGQVHRATERIEQRDTIEYATPVLRTLLQATPSTSSEAEPTYVVALGVIPSPELETLAGLPTARLTDGDPYYANGSYDGSWTGEAIVSSGGAEALGIDRGESFTVERGEATANRTTFRVVAVSNSRTAGTGQLPVVIVHLSELQQVTGAVRTDSADRILVAASDASVRHDLEGIYSRTDVLTRRGLVLQQSKRATLPAALGLSAFIVAVVVGTLFVSTTMGMDFAAGSRQRAVLAAIGFSPASRVAVVVLQALVVSLLGGIVGVALAILGVSVSNALATAFVSDVPIAVFRPILVAYGLGLALLIGVLSIPYLLAVSMRDTTMEDIPQ